MHKSLKFVIQRFPGREKLIRAYWNTNEDFEELCEHFTWMSEAAETNPDAEKARHFAGLRDELHQELEACLTGEPNQKLP